ncbi:MAG: ATP synthase F0 subunit B [Desulfobacterales bacterium]|jgi:F-type H+-transporting ATPase subunit b|nr:ATP synthase F0 subunit B [Desulfobacterales bacterium]
MKLQGLARPVPRKRVRAATLAAAGALVLCASGAAWAAAGGDGSHGGFTATDGFRVMNFVVLFAALFFLLRKPIPRALNSRIAGIKDQLKDLEARKAEAERQLAETNQRLNALEKEADRILADYVRQGQEAKARILKEAEAAAAKLQDQARRSIEHEFAQAKVRLQADIFEKSLVSAEELLKRSLTAQDQAHLVEDYLEKVVRA